MRLGNARQHRLSVQQDMLLHHFVLFLDARLHQTLRLRDDNAPRIGGHLDITCVFVCVWFVCVGDMNENMDTDEGKNICCWHVSPSEHTSCRNLFDNFDTTYTHTPTAVWPLYLLASLTGQPVHCTTRVRLERIARTCIVDVEFTAGQHTVFATNVRIRIQMHTGILYPSGDHHEFGHVTGYL